MNSPANGGVAVSARGSAEPSAGSSTPNRNTLAPHSKAAGSARLSGIDAARGFAMIMVCLSHVRYHFDHLPTLNLFLTALTRVATPTFLLLSGFVAAYVLSSRRPGTRITVIDRGLFVLVVGHLLLNLQQVPDVGWQHWLLARVTVTDAIGICLVIGALSANLSARWLLIAGSTLALISWPIANTATAASPAGEYVLLALFDAGDRSGGLIDAALAPYLGLFLIGMGLSKSSMHLLAVRDDARLARKLFWTGVVATGIAAILAVLWHVFKDAVLPLFASEQAATVVRQGLNPLQKLPPSPAYLMFYSGIALMIAALCLARRPRAIVEPIVNWTATIGRASLMCFVVQDWLLLAVPSVFGFAGFRHSLFWVAYFVAVVLVLQRLARAWDAKGANRFLTIGLKSLAKHVANSKHGVPPIARVREV